MTVHITLNGVKVTKDIPESWDKVTFRQSLQLTGKDKVFALSLFTGIDLDTLNKARVHNSLAVMEILGFLDREIEYSIPSEIMGYKIPHDLESESVAQYADINEIVSKFDKDDPIKNVEQYPLIVATYCVSPYDFKEAEKIAEKLFDAPCTEVMAIGNFTLARLLALKLNIPNPFPRAGTPPNRLKRVMRNWLYRLDFTRRYFSWRKALPSPVRNYLTGR
jgi:hypothetical protein